MNRIDTLTDGYFDDLDAGSMPAPLVRPERTRQARPRTVASRRPRQARPAGAALRYRGTGVPLSRVRGPHRRRAITPMTTVGLSLLAALITVWLGVVAQFGDAVRGATTPVPDRLAVVQVRAGETLAHLAARVAPDAPVGPVVDRIRELNKLETAGLDAGQTLIAPIG
ncbi:MAG: LysM peptidoglycan-binding domain-containing protein [Mycobacterium sp.]|nr:LysM peptidoglycan-binding domain-containing protein [Mycobacterium sp.]